MNMNQEDFRRRARGQGVPSHVVDAYLAMEPKDWFQDGDLVKVERLAARFIGVDRVAPLPQLNPSPGSRLAQRRLTAAMEAVAAAIRTDLFGGPEVPFENEDEAVRWLQEEGVRQQPQAGQVTRTIAKLQKAILELDRVGQSASLQLKSFFLELVDPATERVVGVRATGDPLTEPARAIDRISGATGFSILEVTRFVLLGAQPTMRRVVSASKVLTGVLAYRGTRFGAIRRQAVSLTLYSPDLSTSEIAELARQTTRKLSGGPRRRVTEQDLQLVDAVSAVLPVGQNWERPPWDQATWEAVAKEWSERFRSRTGEPPTWRALSARHRRFLEKQEAATGIVITHHPEPGTFDGTSGDLREASDG